MKNWLAKNITYTLHHPVRKSYRTRPVVVYSIDEQWQADLVDLNKLAKRNNGFKYLLVIIDVLSKYAWVEPLRTKTKGELRIAFERVFSKGRNPKLIQTDRGTEFLNQHVRSLLDWAFFELI